MGAAIDAPSGASATFAPSGLTGATAATRYVGGTAAGPPTSGTFAVGDFVITQAGSVWVCTVAGSPGTWVPVGGRLARKTADTARDSAGTGATLTDDPHLTLPVAASGVYTFECFSIYDASTAGDLKVAFTHPAGATIIWSQVGASGSITTQPTTARFDAGFTGSGVAGNAIGGAGAGTKLLHTARGILVMGGTAGSLTQQWAQNTADATATTLYTGSHLIARRME